MADPLSISGSVVGIISLGLQTTQYLHDFYTALRDREENLANTTRNLKELLDLLEVLNDTVKRPNARNHEAKLLSIIESSVEECKEYIEKLNKEAEKFRKESADTSTSDSRPKSKIQATMNFARRLVYPFAKSTLETLNKNIEEILQRLLLVQQTLLQEDISHVQGVLDQIQVGQARSEIRDWLKAPDATVDFNEACAKKKSLTGTWFVASDEFSSWINNPNSFLWIHGFSGCGKTVLCSTAIQHTYRHRQSRPKIGVAFFFFSFGDDRKQDASAMLRTLVLQLSNQLSSCTLVENLYDRYRNAVPPNQALEDCLRGIIQAFDDVYIMLDALDESPRKTHRDTMLEVLADLHSWSERGLHILVTSRDESDIREEIELLADQIVPVKNDSINQDIASFVSQRLRGRRLEKWSKHHDRIRYVLTDQSNGNFRWVDCQLQEIERSVRSQEALDRLLTSLPASLEETYKRLLAKIEPSNKDYAQQMLAFLCCAKEPLTVRQLIDALAVDLSPTPVFNEKRILEDKSSIEDVCPGLVEIHTDIYSNGTVDTVHIAHFSVQNYLESELIHKDIDVRSFAITRDLTHTRIASTCLVFLGNLGLLQDSPMVRYARYLWSDHVIEGRKTDELQSQFWQLLQNDSAWNHDSIFRLRWSPHWVNRKMRETVLTKWKKSRLCHASFLRFTSAVEQLLNETSVSYSSDLDWYSEEYDAAIYVASIAGHVEMVQLLLDKNPRENRALESSLLGASTFGHESIVRLVLNRNTELDMSEAFAAACRGGYSNIVRLFLGRNVDVNVQDTAEGNTPLMNALERRRHDVAQLLLERSIDVNIRNHYGQQVLYFAARAGFENIVESILAKNADVNARDNKGCTALMIAAEREHSEVAQILLGKLADANIQDNRGNLTLHLAARMGRTKTVRLLIDRTADINQRNDDGETALHLACQRGSKDTVLSLLASNADINAQTNLGRNMLHSASAGCHQDIIELLLDKGFDININAQDTNGSTALHMASQGRFKFDGYTYRVEGQKQEEAVQLLLTRNADASLQDKFHHTALWGASRYGSSGTVKLLLNRIVNTSAKSSEDEGALHAASKHGYEMVVQLLLDRNTDVNAIFDDETALFAASENGHEEIVQLLLNRNADVRKRDKLDQTALMKPSEWGYHGIVQLLLDKNIDINAQDWRGQTALHYASYSGHSSVVQLLLDRGADISAQTTLDGGKNMTALDLAREEGHETVVQMLLSRTTATQSEDLSLPIS